MYYVTDTHSLLWYLADSPQLSSRAKHIFELCDQGTATIVISAIVLLECIDILDKKKVPLKVDVLVSKIFEADNFVISEIDLSIILETIKLKQLKDMHDRIIVATAMIFNAPIVSKDREIKKSYSQTIW